MATRVSIDVEAMRLEVQVKYSEVASAPKKGFTSTPVGPLPSGWGIPMRSWMRCRRSVWSPSLEWATPSRWGKSGPGETVVDVGSGAGFDSLVAGRMVGPAGSVTGVDMTPDMLRKARRNARRMGASNVTFRRPSWKSCLCQMAPQTWSSATASSTWCRTKRRP